MIPHADTCTCPDCIRTAAFAAIRRAIGIARWYDETAKGTDWLTPEYIENCKDSAHAVRVAIRAAIGSEKMPV